MIHLLISYSLITGPLFIFTFINKHFWLLPEEYLIGIFFLWAIVFVPLGIFNLLPILPNANTPKKPRLKVITTKINLLNERKRK